MTTNVRIAKASYTVADAADLMLREHVGALPVMEEAHLRGIITRSDIIGASVALGTHTRMRPVKVQDRQASICTGRSARRSQNIYEKS
jgi:CBS domain-containing protein